MKLKSTFKVTMLSMITCSVLYGAGEESKKTTFDTVTVTANKMEENLQNVPQSITVLDSTVLEEKGVTDIVGIINEIPNMTSFPDHGTMVNFRGLNASMFTNNNPIVIYINNVPVTDRMSYDISMANVERVEVLRGPQGTLYGKDAIGGVINIITKEPTNKHSGNIGIEYGKNNTMTNKFNITGPIKDDVLFYGVNAQLKSTDGWVTNQFNGDDKANKTDDKKFSGFLKFKPTDRLSAELSVSSYEYEKNWGKNQALSGTLPLSSYKRSGAENTSFDVPTIEKTSTDSQSLSVEYNLDDLTITSVTTHRKMDLDSDFDFDFGNVAMFTGAKQFNYTENKEISQELRVSSNKENLKWVAGLYVDDGEREQGPYGMEFGGNINNAVSTSDSSTQAIFAQATFAVTPKLDLTLGGRYQKLERDIDLDMYSHPAGAPTAPMFSLEDEKSWNTFIPKAALAYKIDDSLTTYASISKGYMPGGFNYYAMGGTSSDNSFEPQVSTNYELGIKGTHENFTYTASIFRMDIKDIHIYKQVGMMFLTDNAKEAHSQGIEFDFNYFPTDELEISGAFGFIEAEYDDYDAGSVKYDGETIENTPKETASLAISYHHPEGYYGRVDTNYAGETSYFNSGNQKFEKVGSHLVTNIKVGYNFGDFDIYGFVNNLTDEEHITSYKNNGMVGIATFNDPRTYGVGLNYKF